MAGETVVEHAPAKVNLALHVTGRRADGYHLLDTLVVFTEAGDRVAIAPSPEDRFLLDGPFAAGLEGEDGNLVLRARDLLRATAASAPPVAISLTKNLPVASGIGGGSSDAAATLRALDRLWRLDLKRKRLAAAGLSLGADLPMCVTARSLVARGIGERIEAAPGLPRLAMVLVNPGVAVATPAVFRALDRSGNPPLPPLPAVPRLSSLLSWLTASRNDLERPALALAPAIAEALSALRAKGAAFARMSGSGATCFGVFASDEAASRAAAAISAAAPSWYVTATRTIEEPTRDAGD